MYPILMRLADRGLLETTWATDAEPGRPPRHLYRLTGTGLALAAQLAAAAATSSITTTSASTPVPTVAKPKLAGEYP